MEIKDLPSAVFSLDVNPNPDINQFVFGCSNGNIWSVTYDVENNNVEKTSESLIVIFIIISRNLPVNQYT